MLAKREKCNAAGSRPTAWAYCRIRSTLAFAWSGVTAYAEPPSPTSPNPREVKSGAPARLERATPGFVSPFWLTMRQANQLGGCVRKSEESSIVVFWKIEDSPKNTEPLDSDETSHKNHPRFLLRYFRVFNLEQRELPQAVMTRIPKVETYDHEPIAACAELMGCMTSAPEIVHAGSKAFYSVTTDRVTLPSPQLFSSPEEYYATGFHELIHSTGHEKRLARASILEAAPFGSLTYSAEELVAEIGAAYLCAESGISPAVIENQAAYVSGWLKKLRDDRRLLIRAATQAQRAADYVSGRIPTAL
jgi:antirestriction protein ArdC